MCKLSIIVPIYNMEKYLNRCVDSLLAQTLEDIEIILVNDGSTDSTVAILEEYRKIDKRVKLINKPNGGVSSAWIEGIQVVQGEFTGFVDPDDYCEKEYFNTLYSCAISDNVDIVYSGFKVEEEDGEIIEKVFSSKVLKKGNYEGAELEKAKREFYKSDVMVYPAKWLKIIKTDLVKKNLNLYDKSIGFGDDMGITFATFCDAKRVSFLDYYGYHYIQRKGSITRSFTEKKLKDLENLSNNLWNISESKQYGSEYVLRQITRQTLNILMEILFLTENKKNKISYMKKIRNMKFTECILKLDRKFLNLEYKTVLLLFKLKMYGMLIFMTDLKKLFKKRMVVK